MKSIKKIENRFTGNYNKYALWLAYKAVASNLKAGLSLATSVQVAKNLAFDWSREGHKQAVKFVNHVAKSIEKEVA